MFSEEEVTILHTALDILTSAYAGGLESEFVRVLIDEYRPGSNLNRKAQAVRKKLDALQPDKPKWE